MDTDTFPYTQDFSSHLVAFRESFYYGGDNLEDKTEAFKSLETTGRCKTCVVSANMWKCYVKLSKSPLPHSHISSRLFSQ